MSHHAKQLVIAHYPKQTICRATIPVGIFSMERRPDDTGSNAMVLRDDGTIVFESFAAGPFLRKKAMKPRSEYTLGELLELYNSVF